MSNKKIVVIHQPDFMPYLGFFDRLLKADCFIILDHVQFVNGSSKSWMHRDKIKTANGEQWLTVSVKRAPRNTTINDIEIATNNDWKIRNLRLIEQSYSKAPYYHEIMPKIHSLYSNNYFYLYEINMASIRMIMDMFDINIPLLRSSSLEPLGMRNELLVDLLEKTSATHYLSGIGARDYFLAQPFDDAGIEVIWQDYIHPIYSQQFNGFISNLSAIDLLFNHGITASREIIRSTL